MSLIQKQVAVVESVETLVKSAVDLASALKNGTSVAGLVGDLVEDVKAATTLVADVTASPFAAANSVALGVVAIVQIVLAPLPVVNV